MNLDCDGSVLAQFINRTIVTHIVDASITLSKQVIIQVFHTFQTKAWSWCLFPFIFSGIFYLI